MPSHDCVKVQVLVDGEPLEEYLEPRDPNDDDSDDEEEDENKFIRYVEATAGQRFSVQITWEPGFALKYAPHLYAELALDDEESFICTRLDCKTLSKRGGKLTKPYHASFEHTRTKDFDGKWKRVDYTFGALSVDENSEEKMTPNKALSIGVIKIRVHRARAVALGHAFVPDGLLPIARDEIPEKALKGRDLKDNVKYAITNEEVSAFPAQNEEYVPMFGNAGRITTFIFKYRTKKALQDLGCIPRSPSPEPDYKSLAARQEELLQEQKRELVKLKMALMNASQHTTPNGGKRPREEDDEELSIVEGPAKKPAVHIDLLTDDED